MLKSHGLYSPALEVKKKCLVGDDETSSWFCVFCLFACFVLLHDEQLHGISMELLQSNIYTYNFNSTSQATKARLAQLVRAFGC